MEQLTTTLEQIGPDEASAYLETNTQNRTLSNDWVKRLAHDMKNGEFGVTHQGIAFDADGRLVDGQHRLWAVVESGTTVQMNVTRGAVDQHHMDRGRIRSTADFMEGSNRALRAAAARSLLTLRTMEGVFTAATYWSGYKAITDGDILRLLRDETEMPHRLESFATAATTARQKVPVSGTAILVAAAIYPRIANDTLEAIATGVGLGVGDPVLALRNYGNGKVSGTGLGVFLAVKTFQAVSNGKAVRVLNGTGTLKIDLDLLYPQG